MFAYLQSWLRDPWRNDVKEIELLHAYRVTFSGIEGQMVLHDLIDKFLIVGGIPNDDAERHLGRQDVVFQVLANIDMANRPDRYKPQVITK